MKKIAILGAILALSTSALADDNNFYAKIGGFGNIGTKLFDDSKVVTPTFTTTSDNNKYGDFAFGGTIGAGYYVMSNLRIALELSYFAGPNWTYEKSNTAELTAEQTANVKVLKEVYDAAVAAGKLPTATEEQKAAVAKAKTAYDTANVGSTKKDLVVEVTGPAGFLNAYVDIFEAGPAKFFVGAGAGISYVKVEMKNKDTKSDSSDSSTKDSSKPGTWDAKARFAWNVGAGVAFEVSEGINVDLSYSFVSLGKPEKNEEKKEGEKVVNVTPDWQGNAINSNNINLGVRFSL